MRTRFKCVPLLLALALFLGACAPLVEDEGPKELVVYATFYPIYALSERILRDIPSMEIHCLTQPQDGCLRDYALSDWEMYLLAYSADLVIEGGRGLESFSSTLTAMGEDGPAVITILLNMELFTGGEELSQPDEEASHRIGANPHYYLSVEGARHMLEAIAISMAELDPDYGDRYFANLDAAEAELDALEAEIDSLAGSVSGKKAILMNETAIYPAQDLNLEVAEWIERESGDMLYGDDLEACIASLSAGEARVALLEKQAPKALTDALEGAGFQVARIDTLSTGRAEMGWEGYLRALESNARAIFQAFEIAEGTN